jgi:hypothetical protein
MDKPTGFNYNGKRIYFLDSHGKDISFPRWRVILFYARNFGETVFFPSQKEHDDFITSQHQYCYDTYEAFAASGIN